MLNYDETDRYLVRRQSAQRGNASKSCPHCPREVVPGARSRHIREQHPSPQKEKVYCPHKSCNRSGPPANDFPRKGNLDRHRRDVHQEDLPSKGRSLRKKLQKPVPPPPPPSNEPTSRAQQPWSAHQTSRTLPTSNTRPAVPVEEPTEKKRSKLKRKLCGAIGRTMSGNSSS